MIADEVNDECSWMQIDANHTNLILLYQSYILPLNIVLVVQKDNICERKKQTQT